MISKTGLSAGRPSRSKGASLSSLADRAPTSRVNFELNRDLHTKLKVHAAKTGKSVREILTEYIASLPDE
jgi:hypothetical protein